MQVSTTATERLVPTHRRRLGIAVATLLVGNLIALGGVDGPSLGITGSGGSDLAVEGGPDSADATQTLVTTPSAPPEGSASSAASTPAAGAAAAGGAAPSAGTATPLGTKLPVGRGVHGVTDTEIEIGLSQVDPTQTKATAVAVGVDGFSMSDTEPRVGGDAVAEYINAHGGIAGRRLKLVWHKLDITKLVTPSGREQEAQRACADWTEDHHVFAMSDQGSSGVSTMLDCAVNSKTPMVNPFFSTQIWTSEAIYAAKYRDYYYTVSGFLTGRRDKNFIEGLHAQGFFSPGAKIGLLTEDRPPMIESVERVLKPTLAAHGLKVAEEIRFPDGIESPWANYVLQFQSRGITHVISSAAYLGGLKYLFFMRAAESQGYHPVYGLSSEEQLANATANVPAAQLKGARAVGWWPYGDSQNHAKNPVSANDSLCREISKKTNTNAVLYCEPLLWLKAAFDNASEVSPTGLAGGVARMRRSYASIWSYGGVTDFLTGRPDGAAALTYYSFDDGCACFKPTRENVPAW